MPKPTTIRKYGKQHAKSKCDRLFAELPQTPVRRTRQSIAAGQFQEDDLLAKVTDGISTIKIDDENTPPPEPASPELDEAPRPEVPSTPGVSRSKNLTEITPESTPEANSVLSDDGTRQEEAENQELRVLSWSEVCPLGDRISKIAEASYAEVYRVSNERGTSIIKVIRMESPIKPQTKQQQKSGLVDELPHSESDLMGELQISELLADIPGFVMYKERYIVEGKACRELLETHQAFQKKIKRKDPGRLQFYPSPSRYLDDTRFLVVELGDAGLALEDFNLVSSDQLWDILLHCTIALARAEARIEFEHRDLHEGNLCIRIIGEPIPAEERDRPGRFGFSGLDITILDYGLSRASGSCEQDDPQPVAYDMERDLSLFTSEHAPQCRVYRQMRSFLIRGDRVCLPPDSHREPYQEGVDGPVNWAMHEPYTNVLWLAYLFEYMTGSFRGPKKELNLFKKQAKELWLYLDPNADPDVPGFESASDIVRFALESGWIDEDQLMGERDEVEKSILSILTENHADKTDLSVRRSPRKGLQQQ